LFGREVLVVLFSVSFFVARTRADILTYYDAEAGRCYEVAMENQRYAVRFNPEDFGITGNFTITKVFAWALFPRGERIPLLISDADPSEFPDSALFRQDVTFDTSAATWDTFPVNPPLERKGTFWVQFIHTQYFIPFDMSPQSSAKRNIIDTTTWGWIPIECNMSIGVVVTLPSGIGTAIPPILPVTTLSQNYPNPFNPVTTISFSLKKQQRVTLRIYNIRGRIVSTLIDRTLSKGEHSIVWKGGENASGIYYYELRTVKEVLRRQMVLVK